MYKKLAVLILIAFTLTVLTISPLTTVHAVTDVFGSSNAASLHPQITANILLGTNYTTADLVAASYSVDMGHAFLRGVDGHTAHVKMVILNNDRSILAVSNPVTVTNSTGTWFTLTFTGTVTITKASNYYALCIIHDGDSNIYPYYAGGLTYSYITDNSNNYGSPVAPAAGDYSIGYKLALYLTLYEPESPTPTPTGAPTAPPTDIWSGTWIENVIGIILPLALILIPAFIGWKFAKAWGFFAGLNVGVILCYVYGQMIPLWGVVVMLVVDGLMLFGKLGMHD